MIPDLTGPLTMPVFSHRTGKRQWQPKRIHQMTIKEWEAAFPTEDHCADYLVRHRWPTGTIRGPRCGAEVTHSVSTMPYRWRCYTCTPNSGYRFSHIAGTIFENTNKPLLPELRFDHDW
jgi:hypothetical protein